MCSPPLIQNERGFLDMQVNKSLAIPMPASHIQRTDSEIQLHEDTTVAEYRDQCMFNRLVRGIRNRHQQSSVLGPNDCRRSRDNIPTFPVTDAFMEETDKSIENIMSTRNCPTHFSRDLGKVTPTSSGDLHKFQQSGTYQTEESMQLVRHPSRELEDWVIEGFDESTHLSNMLRHSNKVQTEIIPDMYESDDSSFHDDEVFDIDL